LEIRGLDSRERKQGDGYRVLEREEEREEAEEENLEQKQ
jgi:hypothetical protein